MKFGKELRQTVENSLPEFQPMFMRYKALKKCLPSTPPSTPPSGDDVAAQPTPTVNAPFFRSMKAELDKVNAFYIDKQEDYVIRAAELAQEVAAVTSSAAAAPTRAAVVNLKKEVVDFHGCLVLLDSFSSTNYTGFRKILKKHDKKTGLSVQDRYLSSVAITPFFHSNTIARLLADTEAHMKSLSAITKFRRPSHDAGQQAVSARQALPPPYPSACIHPRSALYRVWAHASAAAAAGASSSAPPSQALLDAVDALTPVELGVDARFLAASYRPADYVIAANESLSVGFFVLPAPAAGAPSRALQLLRLPRSSIAVTRLLRGTALLQTFSPAPTATTSSTDTIPSPSGQVPVSVTAATSPAPVTASVALEEAVTTNHSPSEASPGAKGFDVVETRSGVANGPWPAVVSHASNSGVSWTPVGPSAIVVFYVLVPPRGAGESLPAYALTPSPANGASSGTFRASREENDLHFAHVQCW